MNRRQTQKSTTRERILQSALRLLRKRGLASASVADIMADADLTVGGFYAHFPSKEALAEEAIRRGLQERRTLFLARADESNWLPRLQSALDAYFSPAHRDDIARSCPMSMAVMDAARAGTGAATLVEELRRMARAFQTGRDPACPPAPREAALGALALMVGGMILARASRGTDFSDEVLRASRMFAAAALGGLARDTRPSGGESTRTLRSRER
jgi:TetR/AcrR family transcriptional regulator, transcriptional repressor for nem operon